jgi:hypothetical protein
MHAAPENFSSRYENDAAERRTTFFRETPVEVLERIVLGTVWALQPKRLNPRASAAK